MDPMTALILLFKGKVITFALLKPIIIKLGTKIVIKKTIKKIILEGTKDPSKAFYAVHKLDSNIDETSEEIYNDIEINFDGDFVEWAKHAGLHPLEVAKYFLDSLF